MSVSFELIPLTIASAFVFGMTLALLGGIKLPLALRLGINEARVGGLLAALNLAFIPMMLISGIIVDLMGARWIVIGGSLLTGLAIFSVAMSQSYRAALYALILAGIGGSCLMTGAMVLMPAAFSNGQNPAAAVNLGTVFWGLGALATPALADVLIRGMGFRRAISLIAAVCLIPGVVAALGAAEVFPPVEDHPVDLWLVLENPVVWLAGLSFMAYSPLEGSLATWATTYLYELGFRGRMGPLLLSGFWLCFLAARLLFAFLQEQGFLTTSSNPWVILGLALVAAVILGNLAGTHHRPNAAIGLLFVGAVLGPIFPTMVGLLFNHSAPDNHGTAFGTMYALGSTGSLVFPPMIGLYARRTSVRVAFRIPTLLALLVAGAAVLLVLVAGTMR